MRSAGMPYSSISRSRSDVEQGRKCWTWRWSPRRPKNRRAFRDRRWLQIITYGVRHRRRAFMAAVSRPMSSPMAMIASARRALRTAR